MNLNQYPTLICSLPKLPRDFEQPHVPLSRPRLEDRLRMLDEWEVDLIGKVEYFWRWEFGQDMKNPRAVYEELAGMIEDAELMECIDVLVDIRMLTVAVQARVKQRKLQEAVGRWGHMVLRNWEVPDFGLSLRFPWLSELRSMLENGRYADAERKVCRIVWDEMSRIAEYHYFDLPAVIAYVIRWDLINRWAIRDHDKGLERFNSLVEEAIGDYAGQIEQ